MKKYLFHLLFIFQCFVCHSQIKHGLGAILLSKKEYHRVPNLTLKNLPKKNVLADVFYVNTPPVGDQGLMGSCVGWAVGYTYYSRYLIRTPSPSWDPTLEMSPSFIYNQVKLGNCNSGTTVWNAFTLLRDQGVCTISSMPYVDGQCTTLPNSTQKQEAIKNKLYRARWPNFPVWRIDPIYHLDYIQRAMTFYDKPVVIVFEVTEAFDYMWDHGGIWDKNWGKSRGAHCAVIVGYDNHKQMFKVQNQWGLGGDKGFFWVTYDLVRAGCIQEVYTAIPLDQK